MLDLFSSAGGGLQPVPQASALGGDVRLQEGFLAPARAGALFEALRTELAWEQRSVQIGGAAVLQPRLVAWLGDGGSYTYSGLTLHPQPFPALLRTLRDDLEVACQAQFNSCLANLYRDGQDAVGCHADDEPELGSQPVIASISLGATRTFRMKRRSEAVGRIDIPLHHGSLLVMAGQTQALFLHGIPRERHAGPRINLTFRLMR